MMLVVNKPQFNSEELKPGTAIFVQSLNGRFYSGYNCLVTHCGPLDLHVLYFIPNSTNSPNVAATISINDVLKKEIVIKKLIVSEEE